MEKFNLKKAILENKATFFSSLNEGQFSWMTQDTNQQIGSQEENMIPVYMFDDKGNYYYESNYDGYGEFGGVDYYELLDKMNGGSGDRSRGIDLAFEKIKTNSEILFPALVAKPREFDYKTHDFTQQPKNDPNQSWYMEPEEEDYNGEDDYDYSNDYDENSGDGYIDDTDSEYDTGVDEGKKEYYKDAEADDAEHIKALEKDMKDDKKSSKMKMSELKAKIKEMALSEMNLDINDETPESEEDFLAEVDRILAEADEEVAVDDTEVSVGGEENIDVDTTTEVDPNVKAVQDALTQAQAAAQKLGDPKLTDQIGNTITFFTRAHVVDKGAVAEGKESLNEDLTSTITILLAFLIGIPGVPIAGALIMGLINYLFNELPDQRAEAKSLRSYKGPDRQEKVLALAKEIESKLSPGKKRYLKTLVNRIGIAKLEDKAREYRELDRYASSQKSQMDRGLDENLNADIEAALKDLPVPTDMEEGKEKDLNESMFPMLKRILK